MSSTAIKFLAPFVDSYLRDPNLFGLGGIMDIIKIGACAVLLASQACASFSFAGGSSKPRNDKEWDPNQWNDCSYGCKKIPPDSQVLKKFSTGSQENLDSNRFRVLAWNLYKGRKPNFRQAFLKLTQDADVILTSESVDSDPVQSSKLSIQGMGWDFATNFLMKDNVGTGVSVGSRAVARDVRFSRTDDLEPFVKSPKAIIMATFGIPGFQQRLLAISIHGINWDDDEALGRQLRKILPELKKHKGPIVFAGDYNTKNQIRVDIAKQVLGEAGLKRVSWDNPTQGKQLDDAFVRGVEVHSARLIHDYVDDGSDHPAIDLDMTYHGK